jgi:hypothetical protein
LFYVLYTLLLPVYLHPRSTFPDNPDPGLPPGVIAGIVIGVVLFLSTFALMIYSAIKRRRELERMYQANPNDPVVRHLYLSNRFGRRTTEGDLAALHLMQNGNQNHINGLGNLGVPVVVVAPAVVAGPAGDTPPPAYGTKDSGVSNTS